MDREVVMKGARKAKTDSPGVPLTCSIPADLLGRFRGLTFEHVVDLA
jgi:hypothetical protein